MVQPVTVSPWSLPSRVKPTETRRSSSLPNAFVHWQSFHATVPCAVLCAAVNGVGSECPPAILKPASLRYQFPLS
ncbi:hypothetical protein BJV78DRAFT_863698 [Lactifluus subvellereus]|nr:hypothetical protein BJV78DRAFT_863698 [Lactifluus subvellereus]